MKMDFQLQQLADNPSTSSDTIRTITTVCLSILKMYDDGKIDWHDGPVRASSVITAIADRKDVPADAMADVCDYVMGKDGCGDIYTKRSLAQNPITPGWVVDILVFSPDPPGPAKDGIRHHARKHPNLSSAIRAVV